MDFFISFRKLVECVRWTEEIWRNEEPGGSTHRWRMGETEVLNVSLWGCLKWFKSWFWILTYNLNSTPSLIFRPLNFQRLVRSKRRQKGIRKNDIPGVWVGDNIWLHSRGAGTLAIPADLQKGLPQCRLVPGLPDAARCGHDQNAPREFEGDSLSQVQPPKDRVGIVLHQSMQLFPQLQKYCEYWVLKVMCVLI